MHRQSLRQSEEGAPTRACGACPELHEEQVDENEIGELQGKAKCGGPHENDSTLPTKRKHILPDDMEPVLHDNKIVKGDAWLGGTSLAEASRQ